MSLVLRAIQEVRSRGIENAYHFDTLGDEHLIEADTEKIKDVLASLLDNAARYSPEGSSVDVSVEQNDGVTIFHVADRGPGIPERDRQRIFDRFYQVGEAINHSETGIGLGLYISRVIVELHHGTMGVLPREGGGSIFSISIPDRPIE